MLLIMLIPRPKDSLEDQRWAIVGQSYSQEGPEMLKFIEGEDTVMVARVSGEKGALLFLFVIATVASAPHCISLIMEM